MFDTSCGPATIGRAARSGVLAIAVIVLVSACGDSGKTDTPDLPASLSDAATLDHAGNLDAIKQRGELIIATRNAPTIWYLDRHGDPSGPEHDLAAAFADDLGVTPRFIQADTTQAMLDAVTQGKVDMAAGSITRTEPREQRMDFGPDYTRINEQVVCNHNAKPRNVAGLARRVDSLVVPAGTSYADSLQHRAEQYPDYDLHWQEADDVGTEALLQRVAKERIDCTVADSNIVTINRRYYPSLLVMFNLTGSRPQAWPMPKGSDALIAAADDWMAGFKDSGKLADLKDHYYGFLDDWDFVDKNTLVTRTRKVYPSLQQYFASAAEEYDFNKWLLAGQAYQESHWNADAVSKTGVRGIMMLTSNTAQSLGVENRLDPKQSIMGGAEYLRRMERKLPDDISAPDRYYLSLAAYNIGYYHLRDAMTLAKRQGKDPTDWQDVKSTLPLLMQPRFNQTVDYGYAHGTEPVRYVQRIRDYSDVIEQVAQN